MWGNLGLMLLIIGLLGVSYQCVIFVKETIPGNYGRNSGIGCFEMMVMSWLATGRIGVGLFMHSWIWGAIVFGISIFFFGFLTMLLSHLFGGVK